MLPAHFEMELFGYTMNGDIKINIDQKILYFQEFACNGTVVDHPEYGEVIQLQGDQRNSIKSFLLKCKLAKEEQLKVCLPLSL